MLGAALGIGGALLGGIAGAQGNRSNQTSRVELAPESELERQGGATSLAQLTELERLLGYGPGQQDVQAGVQSQRGLADLLAQFSQGGFLPGQQDIQGSQQLAQQLFAGQQEGLNQAFEQQRRQASRNAARMGRGAIDPVLTNMLAQGQTQQQSQLNANIGSFAAQRAQELPLQRLQFAQQLAQVNAGLATQAMQNRQAILGLGSQLRGQEQNFRLGTATRTTEQSGGGGFGGFLAGALGGASAGLQAFQGFSGNEQKSTPDVSGAKQGTAGIGLLSKFSGLA
jgi:hypothetical protein